MCGGQIAYGTGIHLCDAGGYDPNDAATSPWTMGASALAARRRHLRGVRQRACTKPGHAPWAAPRCTRLGMRRACSYGQNAYFNLCDGIDSAGFTSAAIGASTAQVTRSSTPRTAGLYVWIEERRFGRRDRLAVRAAKRGARAARGRRAERHQVRRRRPAPVPQLCAAQPPVPAVTDVVTTNSMRFATSLTPPSASTWIRSRSASGSARRPRPSSA